MQTTALQKIELMKKISIIPQERFREVKSFIDFVLGQSQVSIPKSINLRGIWKNKGFEKIIDLEAELKEVRKEMNVSILSKKY